MPACHAGGHEFESRTHRIEVRWAVQRTFLFKYGNEETGFLYLKLYGRTGAVGSRLRPVVP